MDNVQNSVRYIHSYSTNKIRNKNKSKKFSCLGFQQIIRTVAVPEEKQIVKLGFDYMSARPYIRPMISLLRFRNKFITRRHSF
jgi:hypothetical protein